MIDYQTIVLNAIATGFGVSAGSELWQRLKDRKARLEKIHKRIFGEEKGVKK